MLYFQRSYEISGLKLIILDLKQMVRLKHKAVTVCALALEQAFFYTLAF
jgi:hypothetical protein